MAPGQYLTHMLSGPRFCLEDPFRTFFVREEKRQRSFLHFCQISVWYKALQIEYLHLCLSDFGLGQQKCLFSASKTLLSVWA